MKNGNFVFDCHTGFWDASQDNCKNQYGEAFIETFYAFHNGFNPAGQPQWTMDYEGEFRKTTRTGTWTTCSSRAPRTWRSSPPRS